MAREDFLGVLYNAAAGLGFDRELPKVSFPIDQFLVGSDLQPLREQATDFAAGLVRWQPRSRATGVTVPPRVTIQANGFEAGLDQMNRLFLQNTWGDGLPLNAPTAERVAWILSGTDLDANHVVGKVMPKGGIATVETVAISLAMAGGRPEYLPVLIAALDAFLDPALEHDKLQATSGSTFPVVMVNGPIAAQIRLNSGFGLLGPDPQRPAGASIGRALRLIQQNVGGALPGVGTMAIFGAMRYTNVVIAEDEAGLPEGWLPVAEEHCGQTPGVNAVTLYVATGASNVVRRGVGKEEAMEEAEQGLGRVASYLASACVHYTHGWATGTPGALLIPRPVAKQLHALGWTSKQMIKDYLFEHSKLSQATVRETGMRQWIAAAGHADTIAAIDSDPWPITKTAKQIIIAVAGGAHPTHNFWMQAMSPAVISRKVELPARFAELVATAEAELGSFGEHCQI